MKKMLQVIAAIVAVGAIATWLATGAHRGWTKISKPRGTVDEVTGIVDQTPVMAFVPGVDFLGATLLVAGALTGVSLFFRKPKTKLNTEY